MIIKANDTTYIKFNEETKTSEVLDLTELEADKARLEARNAEIEDKTDEELLAWARENYPNAELSIELADNKRALAEIDAKLEEIANLN